MGPWAMAIFLGILAIGMITAFALVWRRDKTRSQDVSDDVERLHEDEQHRLSRRDRS